MDNEGIVDQIVRSLSFEVIAVPQNVVPPPDSSSKLTPVNVRVRVRKKNESGLRHGILSMPKVERKSNVPERVRLISSDQTIMSFNVVMEGEFDKLDPNQCAQNLNLVTPGLEVYTDDDNYPSLSKNVDTAPILSKRNKNIFGTCKPGGCLDPPFGEEKYSYQPTPLNLSLPVRDDTVKLKTSSIFKNTLFKRRKKSTQDQLAANNTKTTEADSILSVYESESKTVHTPTTYSNSIITYPHTSNPSEIRLEEDKLNKKRYSSEDKSRTSTEGNEGYFVIPKVAKNHSGQSGRIKLPEIFNKISKEVIKGDDINNLNPANNDDSSKICSTIQSESEIVKTKNNHHFIPIPLPALIQGANKDTIYNTENNKLEIAKQPIPQNIINKIPGENIESENYNTSAVICETASYEKLVCENQPKTNLQEIKTLNYTLSNSFSTNKMEKNSLKEIRDKSSREKLSINDHFIKANSSNENISRSQIFTNTESLNVHNTSSLKNINQYSNYEKPNKSTLLNYTQSDETESLDRDLLAVHEPDKVNLNKDDMESNFKYTTFNEKLDVANNSDLKSHPLVSTRAREQSLLNVTTDNSQSVPNVDYSTGDLKHIWKNETEPLMSAVNVISTLHSKKGGEHDLNKLKGNQILELQEIVSDNEPAASEEDFKINKLLKEEKEEVFDSVINASQVNNIPVIETQSKLIHQGQNAQERILENIQNLLLTDARNYENQEKVGLPTVSHHDLQEKHTISTNPLELAVDSLAGNNVKDSISRVELDQNIIKLSHGADIYEKSSNLNVSDIPNQKESQFKDEEKAISNKSSNLRFYSGNTEAKPVFAPDNGAINVELTAKESKLDVRNSFLQQIVLDHSDINDHLTALKVLSENTSNAPEIMLTKLKENTDNQFTIEKNGLDDAVLTSATVDSKIDNNLHNIDAMDNLNKSKPAQSSFLLLRGPEQDLTDQVISESLKNVIESPRPAAIHRKQPSWKMDLALQVYINDNNDRVIKSLNSANLPERHQNDTFLVVQCEMDNEENEIKIPIDHENDMCIQIKKNSIYKESTSDVNEKSVTINELYRKDEMGNKDTFAEHEDYEDVNMSEAKTYNKVISADIREVLIAVYEQELVPLQDIIRGLREEIDMMSAYQIKYRDRAQNLTTKRSRPLRLVANKKCPCVRKI